MLWLKGYCHPIRFNDLAANGKIPQELLDALPPAEAYAKGRVPDPRRAGRREGRRSPTQWDAVVGANVQYAR